MLLTMLQQAKTMGSVCDKKTQPTKSRRGIAVEFCIHHPRLESAMLAGSSLPAPGLNPVAPEAPQSREQLTSHYEHPTGLAISMGESRDVRIVNDWQQLNQMHFSITSAQVF